MLLSLHVQLSVTSPLFQPLLFAGVRLTKVMTGVVLSMLMPVLLTAALTLPALSVQVPVADD